MNIKNILITVAVVVILAVIGFKTHSFGSQYDTSNFSNVEASDGIVMTGGSATFGGTGVSFNSTTTVAASYDGYNVRLNYTMATGTAKAVFTNTFGPAVCVQNGARFSSSGFTPSLVFSIGTSTSATGYATNILASTTVATSTADAMVPLTYTAPFLLGSGVSIVGAISDITNAEASSTYYTRGSMEMGFNCHLLGA